VGLRLHPCRRRQPAARRRCRLVHRATLVGRREESAALGVACRGGRTHHAHPSVARGRGPRPVLAPRARRARAVDAPVGRVLRRGRVRVRIDVLVDSRRARPPRRPACARRRPGAVVRRGAGAGHRRSRRLRISARSGRPPPSSLGLDAVRVGRRDRRPRGRAARRNRPPRRRPGAVRGGRRSAGAGAPRPRRTRRAVAHRRLSRRSRKRPGLGSAHRPVAARRAPRPRRRRNPFMKRTPAFFAFFAFFAAFAFFTAFASAQQPAAAADQDKKDEGIPVTSPLVRQRCGSCHRADEQGRMTRISYRRTTAEGWEETIKRMVALNDVKLDPSDAREIIRYLADHHGLAPEEAQPGAFEVERRMVDYKYTADKDTEETCIKCHSFGRVLLQRRTKEEWELLLAMHRGYYPLVDFQAFRRGGPPPRDQKPGPDGRPPDNRHPMEKALAHLTTAFPLTTPEWSAW